MSDKEALIARAGAALHEYESRVGEMAVGERRHRAAQFAVHCGLEVEPVANERSSPVILAVIASADALKD